MDGHLFNIEDVDPSMESNLSKFEPLPKTQAEKYAKAAETFPQYRHDIDEPNTSFEAALSKKPKTAKELLAVFQALQDNPDGLTDWEISQRVGILRTSAGARRISLRDEGLVEFAGFTRPTDTGRRARVWRITKET